MTTYWLLFAYFAIGTLLVPLHMQRSFGSRFFLLVGVAATSLMIGLRYRVGADWYAYKRIFARADVELYQALFRGDPGYELLNWLVQQIGAGLWLVNLVCGLIFAWGLWRFAKVQRDAWLTILVAVPYLVIVVAMGYTRQAVAIGFILSGLAALFRCQSPVRFLAYAVAAALFHKTAVAVLPLVLLSGRRNQIVNIAIAIGITYFLYDLLVAGSSDLLVRDYITEKYKSQGAGVRLALITIPALLFLVAGRRFGFADQERLIWRSFSLAALGLLFLLLIMPSSTAVDRLALYILPLQLAVMSRIPGSLSSVGIGRAVIILYALATEYVWLNYAVHSRDWIPYQAVLFN